MSSVLRIVGIGVKVVEDACVVGGDAVGGWMCLRAVVKMR